MKTALYSYQDGIWQKHASSASVNETAAQLVLCFGSRAAVSSQPGSYILLKEKFPSAVIAICSTAGEIHHTEVRDEGLSVTVMEFADTVIRPQQVHIDDFENSFSAGKALLNKLSADDLAYVLILSDGRRVNGSELVRGFYHDAQKNTLITGGLAGDGPDFVSTLVGINNTPQEGLIAGIGFYGKKLRIGHGSKGGWEMFGLQRVVTRSQSNVLYELDGKNALSLYKRYLAADAALLPASALLFPLAVTLPDVVEPVVRTILSINDKEGSMTFAGDIPEGSDVRFMRANFDKLTVAASSAAAMALMPGGEAPSFALLISCVGRKMILNERTDEEVAAVDEVLGGHTLMAGFYSYGELSPLGSGACQLHNQTMTITTFYEME